MWDLYISNLQHNVSVSQIKEFLEGGAVQMKSCYILSSRVLKTKSGRVHVRMKDKVRGTLSRLCTCLPHPRKT